MTICDNRDIGLRVHTECDNCTMYKKGETYQLSKLIPKGHCFELLHSVLPYIVTFEHGGWFKWERNRDIVVVCCPSVEDNVCVELKKIVEAGEVNFQYKIINVRGYCPVYEINKVFAITRKDFSLLCWELFNIIFPYLRISHHGSKVICGVGKGKGLFELLDVEKI